MTMYVSIVYETLDGMYVSIVYETLDDNVCFYSL